MVKQVVSYRDDVFVWVYLDQVDRVVRYEAYVIGYDDRGQPSTLDFVIEEGVLDNAHEVPLICELLREVQEECRFGSPPAPAMRLPWMAASSPPLRSSTFTAILPAGNSSACTATLQTRRSGSKRAGARGGIPHAAGAGV